MYLSLYICIYIYNDDNELPAPYNSKGSRGAPLRPAALQGGRFKGESSIIISICMCIHIYIYIYVYTHY